MTPRYAKDQMNLSEQSEGVSELCDEVTTREMHLSSLSRGKRLWNPEQRGRVGEGREMLLLYPTLDWNDLCLQQSVKRGVLFFIFLSYTQGAQV